MSARTIDVDLECWFCADAFTRAAIEADAQLVPRRRDEGGPYFTYRCPRCDRPSRVERNRAGALMAAPPPIVPFADALVAAFDGETRAELAAKRAYFKRRAGRREWFFGAYADELWAAGVRPGRASQAERPRPAGAEGQERGPDDAGPERDDTGPRPDDAGPDDPDPQPDGPEPVRGADASAPTEPHEVLGIEPWDPLESTCRHASLSIL